MKIKIVWIGKTEASYLQEGIDIYLKRLKNYVPYEVKTLPEIKQAHSLSIPQLQQAEAKLLLQEFSPTEKIILLDENGKSYTSVQFSEQIEKWQLQSNKQVTLVIGGAYGFSENIYQRADGMLSLSAMTFSHQMVRLLLVEQVYRAYSILNHSPYHHI